VDECAVISNVLFDLDGTLTDPKDGIIRCIQFSLSRLGIEAPHAEALVWCIGPPLRASFSRLIPACDDTLLEAAVNHYRERFSDIGIYENGVYPGVIPALRKIRAQGFLIFLATSKPAIFARRILDHFGLTRFFHGIYGSELDGRLSDKKELVDHILKTEGLIPQFTLMVGDRCHDVLGGKKNGTKTAAVTYGYGSLDEIREAKPDFIFYSPHGLAAFLNQAPKKRKCSGQSGQVENP
jgi:phosphoglycolate phosphatase